MRDVNGWNTSGRVVGTVIKSKDPAEVVIVKGSRDRGNVVGSSWIWGSVEG